MELLRWRAFKPLKYSHMCLKLRKRVIWRILVYRSDPVIIPVPSKLLSSRTDSLFLYFLSNFCSIILFVNIVPIKPQRNTKSFWKTGMSSSSAPAMACGLGLCVKRKAEKREIFLCQPISCLGNFMLFSISLRLYC